MAGNFLPTVSRRFAGDFKNMERYIPLKASVALS
jgi:hypothetical protein